MMESKPSDLNSAPGPLYHRKHPFLAEMREQRSLTRPGSIKDTRHVILGLEGSGLDYTPGDSLAIFARNPPALVEEILALLNFDPETPGRDPAGGESTLRDVLERRYILNRASKKIIAGLAEIMPQGEQRNRLMEIADNDEVLNEYVHTRDYVDILKEFDEAVFESAEAFLTQLSPIPPRLYSIASSHQAHPGEVHLCVGVVRYTSHGRAKSGLCTGFLADLTRLGEKCVPVYVQPSKTFRLPVDRTRDIIMVGPGTGIAPFRAFLEQRILEGASGRNWLFFGEQHRATEFFYEEELTAWQQQGVLHQLDLAFSRDQGNKIYVQHRMKEHARQLWDWLQQGAYLYVCGDAKRMAKDVHQTIITIAHEEGGMTRETAEEYVQQTLMKTEKRYLRDVY